MDFVQVNRYWSYIESEPAEQSLYTEAAEDSFDPEPSGTCDAFRDPELLPRVGDQYQVAIPQLITESAYLLLTENPTDAMIFPGTPRDFLVGLPITLMWINEEVEGIKHEPGVFHGDLSDISHGTEFIKSESVEKMHICSEGDLRAKIELQHMDIEPDGGIKVEESMKLYLQKEMSNEMHLKCGGNGYHMVPGSKGNTWSNLEETSFILGLYVFGKNLVQVMKFVGSKKMGDILSFYYGKFYGSDRYRRWLECRKIRSRRCGYGQRIFTGWRQQELLSRLIPHVSEECQNNLMEVAKAFGEGKMLFEEYIFSLKATVGLNALVEAVGIGKGKQDLTGTAMELLKSNQVAPVRPEIPIGKACSNLTPLEIVNFLTGGYRLSKARSNDLFWEAVWPRLLARGWHSEQPRDYYFPAALRNSLVFLVPGVKKFSRRKLVKGDHYFDSVSDVLNKVAADPSLLELDIEDNKEENGWINETKLDQGDFPDQQRHCYLKPRAPSHRTDVMKFTVVDTSLANGETSNVRELRSLPVEIMNISPSRSDSEESDGDSSEGPTDKSDPPDNWCFDGNKGHGTKSTKINFDKGSSFEKENFENNALKRSSSRNGLSFIKVPVRIPKEKRANKWNDMQPRKAVKAQAIRSMKSDRDLLARVEKRRKRLTMRDSTETSCGKIDILIGPSLKQHEAGHAADNPDLRENTLSHVASPQKLSTSSSSSRNSPNISDECTLTGNFSGEHHDVKPQPRTLIDLNVPIPQEAETESMMMEMTGHRDQTGEQLEDPSKFKTAISGCDSASEQPSDMNSRRHSTRNRPLTTKALEALACGFLTIKQKRKSKDEFTPENSTTSRSSQRARSKSRISENCDTDIMNFKGDDSGNGVCKNNGEILDQLQA